MPLPTECYACGQRLYTISFDGVRCLNIKCPRFDITMRIHECEYDIDDLGDGYWNDFEDGLVEENK